MKQAALFLSSILTLNGGLLAAEAEVAPLRAKESRFPVLYKIEAIQAAYLNPDSWQGRSISVEGVIASVIIHSNGRPSFELQLQDIPEVTIWAMFPRTIGQGAEPRAGERLCIAGWMRESEAWEKSIRTSLPRQNPMILLANCLVIVPSLEVIIDPKFIAFCAQWQHGRSLPDMAR